MFVIKVLAEDDIFIFLLQTIDKFITFSERKRTDQFDTDQ